MTQDTRERVDPGVHDGDDTLEMTVRDAIALALREELIADDHVFIMGEDIGAYGGSYVVTKGFFDEFGDKLPGELREALDGLEGRIERAS